MFAESEFRVLSSGFDGKGFGSGVSYGFGRLYSAFLSPMCVLRLSCCLCCHEQYNASKLHEPVIYKCCVPLEQWP